MTRRTNHRTTAPRKRHPPLQPPHPHQHPHRTTPPPDPYQENHRYTREPTAQNTRILVKTPVEGEDIYRYKEQGLRKDPVCSDGGEEDRDGVVVREREEICRALITERGGYA
jgi:hypothetical protein